jgi:hypothetical protein
VDVWSQVFLTSALVGGEWSASRACRLTPRERALVPIGWEAGWDNAEKILDPIEKPTY